MQRESMQFDVVVVGAGPGGLAAACRLGQLARETGREISVCVVEKGAAVGAHIVSGALLETRALDELFPDWADRGAPVEVAVGHERVSWLAGAERAVDVPAPLVPRPLHNRGNYVVSLGRLCRWLAEQAEALGCHVLPGFAATDVVYDGDGRVSGVVTGGFGLDRAGAPKANAAPGYALDARYVVFAEGCRGNLGRELRTRFGLGDGADPPHYAIGLKEIWQVDPGRHAAGTVLHTLGWPLDDATDGGGFVYHGSGDQLYVGFVVGLGYRNPHLSPFDEFQRWKRHPRIRGLLDGGQRIEFGARAIAKGGLASLPRLSVPGGLLIGCDAGFLNPAKAKGTHTAMKSGMLAAEAIAAALQDADAPAITDYEDRVRGSWLHAELHAARNFSAGLARLGTLGGAALAFVEHNVLRGRLPLTLRNPRPDHAALVPAARARPIDYPAPDGAISFDRESSVYLSNTHHEEDQPCHLKLVDPNVPIAENLPAYGEPARLYCPAAVYDVERRGGADVFVIHAANCIHCKTCEIKDPAQNIRWEPPEGGGGPGYSSM